MELADCPALTQGRGCRQRYPLNTDISTAGSGQSSQGREARERSEHRFFIGREGCDCSVGGENDIGAADTACGEGFARQGLN